MAVPFVTVIPERYVAYIEGLVRDAVHAIAAGRVPEFMDDEHKQGRAVICLAVVSVGENEDPQQVAHVLKMAG